MATADSTTEPTPIEDARDELQDAIPKAAETLSDLLDAEDERVQIRAAEAILDRAGLTKAKTWSTKTAQVQGGGGEREGRGINRTDPLEDGDESDDLF
jgi:predicted carbohydrate-binding protein with CBM5 and CBM33 domain